MKKIHLLNYTLAVIFLVLAMILATSCAGRYDVQPGVEAYVDSNGNRVAAVGVEGPRVKVDSDGLIIGPGTEGIEGAANKHSTSLNDLSSTIQWGLGFLILGLAGLGFYLKKKD